MSSNANITILVDNDSWIIVYANQLRATLSESGYTVHLASNQEDIQDGWINFMLGCTKKVLPKYLSRNRFNLVVHESDLPKGKGFAPMSWQILEGKNTIPVCLLEADENLDTGKIWLKDSIQLKGNELHDEWRHLQGIKTIELCMNFVKNHDKLSPITQSGESSFYPRRKPLDSQLDISKSLKEQFNLLRIVDNKKYPAFFKINDEQYILKIERAL